MRRFSVWSVFMALCILAVVVSSMPAYSELANLNSISADDFLSPALAKTPDEREKRLLVQNPAGVQTETTASGGQIVVVASSAQDAINNVVQAREVGCKQVKFSSGFGWVGIGNATYQKMENSVATRISRRNAYLKAFMVAKTKLAQSLNGLSNEGKNEIRESLKTINTEKDALAALQTDSKESIQQAVQMMMRGFVIYDVFDDVKQNIVWVSLVTTPRTRGKYNRPDANSLQAEKINEGLDAVLLEIRNGLVPPVGGRIINVVKTGEIAFVGFGSAVVQSNANPAIQSKLSLQAEKIAHMRAADAVCGLIIGDDTRWKGSLDDQTKEGIKDFEEIAKDDATAKPEAVEIKKLEKTKQEFISKISNTDEYSGIRKGILPPGIITKSWKDADNSFVYAVSVYVPSATLQATKDGVEMKDSQILQSLSEPMKPLDQNGTGSGFLNSTGSDSVTPSTQDKQGPSGTIQNDKDL